MFRQSSAPVLSQALTEAFLSALSTVPGTALLATPKVHLFTAGPTPILPTSTPSQFTEATFTGYALIALPTLVGPVNLPGTDGYGVFAGVNFIAGAISGGGQNIAGYWLDNGTATFYAGETFATPVPFNLAGDFLDLQVIFGLSPFTQTS